MSDVNHQSNQPIGAHGPSGATPACVVDRDVLVTRLLDARAGESDWMALRSLSRADETIWDEIVAEHRGSAALAGEVRGAIANADASEMPTLRLTGMPGSSRPGRGSLVGWAVAAVLALGVVGQQTGLIRTGMEHRPGAEGNLVQVPVSPQSAWANYLSAGRDAGVVVGELPERMVVDVRPSPTGEGYEAFYVRQVLERAWVSDLYKIGVNESGKKVLIPTSAPVEGGSSF